MDKYIIIAPGGNNTKALFLGMRDFPTEKIIVLTAQGADKGILKFKSEVAKFNIPVKTVPLEGQIWESIFEVISHICTEEDHNKLLINTSSGDSSMQCAATSAAFVNGIKAFAVEGNETMLLPIMKFSYYKLLTEKKLSILNVMYEDKECCSSLEKLAKKLKMSLPLLSYHIHGTPKSEGLLSLGLVEIEERKGRTRIDLSLLGKMLIKGYIK